MPSCVLLADRHHGVVEGLRLLLQPMFEIVVMVADQRSLLESAARVSPSVVVVDLSLGRTGEIGWLARLHEVCPGMKVVVVSVHDEPSVSRSAIASGADAFVLKRNIATDLLPACAAVLAGRPFP